MELKKNFLLNSIKEYFISPLSRWRYSRREYNHLKRLIKSYDRKNLFNCTVVINLVRNFRNSLDCELFLGLKLALNGAKVIVLLDDGIMKHWDTTQSYFIPKLEKLHKYKINPYRIINIYERILSFRLLATILNRHIRKKGLRIYKTDKIEYIFYSDIFKKQKIDYSNLKDLKKHAKSSTIRFFQTSELDFNLNYVKYFYNLSLKNAVLSRTVANFIADEIKPDFCINAHGIYSTHGPAYEQLKKRGIKSLVWAGPNLHSTSVINVLFPDTIVQSLTKSNYWKSYKNVPVTDEMKQKVKEFFKQRTHGGGADISYYKLMDMNKKLDLKDENDYEYKIALFSHLIWDGNIGDRHIAFDGFIDWLISTIKFVRQNKNIKLYIKPHPYEKKMRDPKNKIHNILKNYFNFNEIENIEFILPELNINTYDFIKNSIDLGIVYDGFLGLELPYFGIPTITCALEGFSSIEDGNITVKSKDEYFSYLSNLTETIGNFKNNYQKILENIIRYIYWYVFKITVKLPTLKYGNIGLLHLKEEDLFLTDEIIQVFNKFTSD
ncbi:MAG: hypothetical protein ACFFAN_00420 [Promethearchaeota archaeon]